MPLPRLSAAKLLHPWLRFAKMAHNNPRTVFFYLLIPAVSIIFIYSFLFAKFSMLNQPSSVAVVPSYGQRYVPNNYAATTSGPSAIVGGSFDQAQPQSS